MARPRRITPAGVPFHIVNRGNDRRVIFRDPRDYQTFRRFLEEGTRRFPVDVFGHCEMPNHFHLLVQPKTDVALSAYMQWVTCRYACNLRVHTQTVGHGHVFQRRFWSAPINSEPHFLHVLRYVEANPLRAQLVTRAEEWQWSSFCDRHRENRGLLSPLPVCLPEEWTEVVNVVQEPEVLNRLRRDVTRSRGRPRKN